MIDHKKYGDSWFEGTEVLWESGKWVVITDRWCKNNKPTATLWHLCEFGKSTGCDEETGRCYRCDLEPDEKIVGFYRLIRMGREQG